MKLFELEIGKSFGISTSAKVPLPLRDEPELLQLIPSLNPLHHFDEDFVRQTLDFFLAPFGDALKLVGPTGSGKSSGVKETCARLRWPLIEVTATGSLEFLDLVGGFQLVQLPGMTQPVMQFVDGPLTRAMRSGACLLINEYDYADPDEVAGLNDIIQGSSLYIQATGEIITPHPYFRLVVTGNTNGTGDPTRRMLGTKRQNLAANDRYRVIEVDYLDDAIEIDLLKRQFPNHPEQMQEAMVKFANAVRSRFVAGEISSTLSTRALLRWTHLQLRFVAVQSPLFYAANLAFLRGMEETDREAVNKIADGIFATWRDVQVASPQKAKKAA